MKSLFEEMIGTYRNEGDYYIPNLELQSMPYYQIGKYGRMEILVTAMAKQEGVTEALKAAKQMEWIRCMNSIRNRAEEINLTELYLCGSIKLYLPFPYPFTGTIKLVAFSFLIRLPAAVTESPVIEEMSERPKIPSVPMFL